MPVNILKKSVEQLRDQVLRQNDEYKDLETQLAVKSQQIEANLKRISEFEEAIKKLENTDESTSKSKKAKR